MKTLIDNRRDFTIWLDEGPVLLGESGIVVSFSRTAYTKLKKRPITGHLTIRFEDKNGASVDFHAWCACRPRWPLEYGLKNAKEWRLRSWDEDAHLRVGMFRGWDDLRDDRVNETVVFHQLRLTASSRGEEEHGLIIKVYATRDARAQQNELFVLRALVARGRAKATSRTALWLKWLLGAGSLALPDELVRQVLGFWRPTE